MRNPKCASSAVKIALWRAIDQKRGVATFAGHPHGPGPWDMSPGALTGKTIFAVVREPFSRIYSAYTSKMTGRREPRLEARWRVLGHDEPGDFGDFVRALPSTPLEQINPHWLPQALLVPERTDRIFRLERPEALDRFLQRTVNQPLAVYRASRYRRPMADAYTPETEAIVRKVYADDFARFGYPDRLAAAIRRAEARRHRATDGTATRDTVIVADPNRPR